MISTFSFSAWVTTGRLVGDHLWQSTLFAALAGLVTLAFRNNRAQVRNALWLAASVKFLIPFAVLIAIGGHFGWRRAAPLAQNPVPSVIDLNTISQPFSRLAAGTPPTVVSHSLAFVIPILLFAIWLCGCGVILLTWWRGWRRVAVIVRQASPVQHGPELVALRRLEGVAGITKAVTLVSSDTSLEPGVFGITAPVLLWPRSLAGRLTDAHIEMILAHELSHVRRRDNLAAAVHMLVETLFWFHPLVWWLGARMVDERERACDEDVLQLGGEPQVYAESVLKVCEFYLESPLTCVAGVTGSNLKKRMERIMSKRVGETLTGWRKLFLATAGVAALAVPLVVGMLTVPRLLAQSAAQDWQRAAGGKMSFDVASVKPDSAALSPTTSFSNIPLGPQDMFSPTGGSFSATNMPLIQYFIFAYKLTPDQYHALDPTLPKWVNDDRFDIQAKAQGNPTKDQYRLMMQSLLADRFQLVVHYETRQLPVFALVFDKPGKFGPQFQLHPADSTCSAAPPAPNSTFQTVASGFPEVCGVVGLWPSTTPGRLHMGGRNVTIDMIVATFTTRQISVVDRPILNKTGITEKVDFVMEFTPPIIPAGHSEFQPDPDGPTFQEALKDNLGFKLQSQTGSEDILVVDHVEHPSPN